MCDMPVTTRTLNKKVRSFVRRAQQKRKSHQCRQCARLRRDLAPILSALTNLVLMSDVVVEQDRQDEARAAVEDWMMGQLNK